MGQLLVRGVPRDIIEALKRRAAEHGRSAEAEHRGTYVVTDDRHFFTVGSSAGFAERIHLLGA